MSIFDIALIVIIACFGLFGLWFGFIQTLGSLLGTVLGTYLAGRYYEPMADWLTHVTGWSVNGSRVIMFILAFVLINRLVGFVFWLLAKFFGILTRLPFIHSIDKVFGAVLGIFEGILTMGIVFYFIARFPVSAPVMAWVASSKVVPFTVSLASVLIPFFPEALRLLKATVEYVEKKIMP